MSKQLEALAALLVKGARVTLNAFTIDGKKASNILTGREQLVVDVDDKGISLIVSDPKSARNTDATGRARENLKSRSRVTASP